MEVSGTLWIQGSGGNQINSDITVKSGGSIIVATSSNRLIMGTTADCGYKLKIETGGLINVANNSSSRLVICNEEVIWGGSSGGCNPCSETPPGSGIFDCTGVELPYCENGNGFNGPITFTEDGVQPIDLLYFEASTKGSSIEIDWITSKEENFSHFVLEHSVNGSSFTALAEIEGAGYNTESLIEYSYTHKIPKLGVNYYRLKAVDLDGTYEYFGPISVRFNGEEQLWISPNPSAGDKVAYQTNFTPNENDRVLVYNQLGSVVADEPAIKNNGTVYFSESLNAGAYILKYSTGQQVLFARFIVVK
jgi:hypothetical protein